MIVTGINTYSTKDKKVKKQILLSEPANIDGYIQVTSFSCDVHEYDDLTAGVKVDVEFGSYEGRLYIKSIKY